LTSEGPGSILDIEKKRASFSEGEEMETKRTKVETKKYGPYSEVEVTYTEGGIRYRKTTVYEVGKGPITTYIVRTKSEAKNI